MGFLKFLFPVCFFWLFLVLQSFDYQCFTISKQILKKYVLDESAYLGGVLIRQLKEVESGEILKGPLACAELLRCYDATGVDGGFVC